MLLNDVPKLAAALLRSLSNNNARSLVLKQVSFTVFVDLLQFGRVVLRFQKQIATQLDRNRIIFLGQRNVGIQRVKLLFYSLVYLLLSDVRRLVGKRDISLREGNRTEVFRLVRSYLFDRTVLLPNCSARSSALSLSNGNL